MNQKYPAIIRSQSQIAYNYATIKITKSRIDKGLLAIPVSLIEWFPKQNCQINIFLDDSIHSQLKTYTSYMKSQQEPSESGTGSASSSSGESNIPK